ncbi:hypothetical protein SADUNF_Sadunf02G0091900 [Salix dunnii]|uniref:Uncharacterized protein n=1 Tax=Salix dunnii TaxID=1413687 RepID=A0A835TJD5_9ROSI|nr:hypothetical protein SADUNF_Sadunf02G0091900 [Salix dunnii]
MESKMVHYSHEHNFPNLSVFEQNVALVQRMNGGSVLYRSGGRGLQLGRALPEPEYMTYFSHIA